MNVEIKATKYTKEKGGKNESKEFKMIPRTRTLRIGEIYFPTKTMVSNANYERILRILDRSKYTRIFQDSNKELLRIIKDLNPRLTQKEIKELLTKYEKFEQPKEMAIALEEEVKNIKKLIRLKNKEIEYVNEQTIQNIDKSKKNSDKQINEIKTELQKQTKEFKKEAKEKIKEIKKDVQELQAEAKKLLTRAEKYKKIKYDRK